MTEPASYCGRCRRPGIVHEEQHIRTKAQRPDERVRFFCVCGHEWIENREFAELTGAFLARIRRGAEVTARQAAEAAAKTTSPAEARAHAALGGPHAPTRNPSVISKHPYMKDRRAQHAPDAKQPHAPCVTCYADCTSDSTDELIVFQCRNGHTFIQTRSVAIKHAAWISQLRVGPLDSGQA